MPEFKKVPDAPGYWVKYELIGKVLGGMKEVVRYHQHHILSTKVVDAGNWEPKESHAWVYYGPLPTELPEGWE